MSHYQYRCFHCGSLFSASEIEAKPHYLCPKCGKVEKNAPLTGVLEVIYNYRQIGSVLVKEQLLRSQPGRFWNYAALWPLAYSPDTSSLINISADVMPRIQCTSDPILTCRLGERSVFLFDDTRNPTFSYKDRASVLVALKALQHGITEIVTASTGNAASSLAGICARLGLNAHVFVPSRIPAAKRVQIQAYGAQLYIVDGDYDAAFDLSIDIAVANGWYNRNTGYNPLTIEGKKSSVYDMFIALNGVLPNIIVVPVGDGVILSGIYKGLWELQQLGWLERLPRLYAVQAKKSDALLRFVNTGVFEYRPAASIADSICAGAPRLLDMAASAVQQTNGQVIAVSDEHIMLAQKTLTREWGILAEPAAAATLAGFLAFQSKGLINDSDSVMLMVTGNGLKDMASLERWNQAPNIRTVDEWRDFFGV